MQRWRIGICTGPRAGLRRRLEQGLKPLGTSLEKLDWDDLRVFLEAAKSRSVTRAARGLGLDHSTVSRRLSRLEFAVGAALFGRSRNDLALTETDAESVKNLGQPTCPP